MLKQIRWIALAICLTVVGCAHRAQGPVVKPKVSVITLVPIEAPKQMKVENASAPVVGLLYGGIASAVLNQTREPEIEALYGEYRKDYGARLTEALQKALQARGFTVQLAAANQYERSPKGALNYRKLGAHEAVMDVRIDALSLYSSRVSPMYWPMLNTSVSLINPANDEETFSSYVQYGAYARGNEGSDIESDGKFFFPVYADIIQNPAMVKEAFDQGLNKTAERIAQNLSLEIEPAKATPAKAVR